MPTATPHVTAKAQRLAPGVKRLRGAATFTVPSDSEGLVLVTAHASGVHATCKCTTTACSHVRAAAHAHGDAASRSLALRMLATIITPPAPVRYGRCTALYNGRPADARHAERLPNGLWRVDFISGLVGLYDEDPIANSNAHQRH